MEQGISRDVQTIFRFLSPEKKEEMVKKTRTDRSLLSMEAIYDFS